MGASEEDEYKVARRLSSNKLRSSTVQGTTGFGETEEEPEYEYVYEDGEPALPPPEFETKVSVSVSSPSTTVSTTTIVPQPSNQKGKLNTPENGVVISVATTKSISSRLTPVETSPPTIPVTTVTPTNPSSISSPATIEAISPRSIQNTNNKNSGIGSSSTLPLDGIKFEDVSKFLPKDYHKTVVQLPPPASTILPTSTPPSTLTTSTATSISSTTQANRKLESLLQKIEYQEIPIDFLPKGYSITTSTPTSTLIPSKPSTTYSTTPDSRTVINSEKEVTKIQAQNPLENFKSQIKFETDISALLPPGYTPPFPVETESSISTTPLSSSTSDEPSSTTSGTIKLIFPTRPGLPTKKPRTTPEPPKADTPPPLKVNVKSGWPTRKTTQFTGWPTTSTVAPPTTSMTTEAPTTTTTTTTTVRTTTTLAPPKRSPLSMCESELCKMEATLRLVGGIRWKPEYADINTEEWKQLESVVKRELDGAYRSSGLAPFYRAVEIEAFNEGSVVVDYFVILDNVDRQISSEQVRTLFHGALLQAEEEERLRLGRYSIDPRFTDFKVRAIESEGISSELEEALIPQWGIAVIVIGLASLIFVIIFAVTLAVSRQRKGGGAVKKGGIPLTQEMLMEFNKRNLQERNAGEESIRTRSGGLRAVPPPLPSHLYNNLGNNLVRGCSSSDWMDKGYVDQEEHFTLDFRSTGGKFPTKTTSRNSNGGGFNIYDSWKTEWNGYTPSYTSANAQNYYGAESFRYNTKSGTRRQSSNFDFDDDTNF